MYESRESTEYNGAKSVCSPTLRYLTRVKSSQRMAKSKMSGVASRES
jgi:hypothetical protein